MARAHAAMTRESISDEGSHVTVHDFVQISRTRWKIIGATIVIAVLGALAYALLVTPQYLASTRLFVSTTTDGTNSQTYDGGLFAERRVLSYTELLMGELLAQRTIDKLGLDMSAADLQENVEASVPADTVLIDVAVTDPSPNRARDIANTLADEFVVMAAGLETPELGAQPNARVIIQQRAEIPDSPENPPAPRTLAIAAVLGALIGVVLALLRDRIDDSVRTPQAVEKATGVGLLADIPLDSARRNNLLIPFDSDRSPTADAFRELRINLRFLEVADGPRVLLVASCLPGDGRTTTAVNLALALAEAGHTVVLVDGDLRRPRVADSLELPGEVGLSTVLAGDAELPAALLQTRFPRLTALSAGEPPANPSELLESQAAKDVLLELGAQFDYVIVDTPSLAVTDATVLAASTQGVLLVARSGTSRRKQLAAAVASLNRAGAPLLGAVLTMSPPKKRTEGADYYGAGSAVHKDGPHKDVGHRDAGQGDPPGHGGRRHRGSTTK
ncbi:MAG: capsular exopolysaccharide biosynthesis protein [Mycobacterium sp.]|nr:capsular exopolysaccharide biosynthesis protein [Mycobacterium sp.]